MNANAIAINGGSVSTTGNQNYGSGAATGDVSIDGETILTARGGAIESITFKNQVNGDSALHISTDTINTISSTVNSPIIFIGANMIVSYGTHNADIFIDLNAGQTMTLGDDLDSNNLYFYNGELDLNGYDITTRQNFAIFGTDYDPEDKGWHVANNTRFAYYGYDSLLYKKTDLVNDATASFADLGTSVITVTGNFYNNGADMISATNPGWTLNIPDRGAPTSNSGDSPTATQWGTRYAVAFNMRVQNSTAVDGWVAAATGEEGQNVTHTGTNSQWQSESPTLTNVYVTTDRTLNFGFSSPGTGVNAEYVRTPDVTAVGNMIEYDLDSAPDKRFSFERNGNNLIATAADRWNTDTVSTTIIAGSTDREGNESDITNDVSLMKGAFYHVNGNTMSRSSGYAVQSGATETPDPAYTDQAHPVLAAVYTGQEAHNQFGAQQPYDAHNFIELRFSEAVNISGDGKTLASDDYNIQVTTDFGAITERDGGLDIAGLITIPKGELETGSRDKATGAITDVDNTVHAFYRNFSIDGVAVATNQTHRLRISIAGLQDGTLIDPVSGQSSNYYPGFIDEATTPSGRISFNLNGTTITGADGLPLDTSVLPTVASNESGLYSEWDTQKPVFAREDSTDGDSFFEAIGIPDEAGSRVLRFEIHLHDNTPTAAEPWTRGWNGGAVRLDTAGGSRPDYAAIYPALPTSPSTQGGLRASTLIGSEEAFSILPSGGGAVLSDITNNTLERYVTNDYFPADINTLAGDDDTLYFSFVPTVQLDPVPRYDIEYDPDIGFITDLAGNRLTETGITTSDLVAPEITLTLAPFTTDGTQQLYVYFNKALDLSGNDPNFAVLSNIHEQLRFFTEGGGAHPDLTAVAGTRIAFETETATGLIFNLSDQLEENELFTLYFQPTNKIRGTNLAVMNAAREAPVTYFGVNTVYPINAVGALDFDFNTPPSAGDISIRSFDGENGLYAHREIDIEVRVENGITGINTGAPLLYLDSNATPLSYSEIYEEETGRELIFWMPEQVTPSELFSEQVNSTAKEFTGVGSDSSYTFSIGIDDIIRSSGDTMQFLFKLGSFKTPTANGTLPAVAATPLYHINLPDEFDLANIGLFAFKVFDETQVGGTTILNNVINVNEKEEMLLEVIMPTDGSLNVTVMTLDGNIVKALSRGRKAKGNHYFTWDGTNNAGNPVARGVYFIRVVGPGIDETRKVMAVK